MEGAFSNNLSMYNIMPNPEPLRYAITLKLSPELLEYLSEDPQGRLSVCFGPKQKIMFNGQSYGLQVSEENRQKPHYCLQESPHGLAISKVGVIKQKFLAKQETLRDADIAKYTDSNKKIELEKESRKIIQIDTNVSVEGRGRKRKTPTATTTRKQIPPSKSASTKRSRISASTVTPAASTAAPVTTASITAPVPSTSITNNSVSSKKVPSVSSTSKKATASMPKFSKSVTSTDTHPAPPPKPKLALQPHLIQLLALDNLTMAQIEEKRPEGKKIISNILVKLAACKGLHYHLKPKFYKEVDLNWEGYSQEERLRVEDNVSNAASLELEAQAAASVAIKSEEKDSTANPAAATKEVLHKSGESKKAKANKSPPVVQIDFGDEESSLKMDISSSDDRSDSDDDASKKSSPIEQASEQSQGEEKASPEKAGDDAEGWQEKNGKDRPVNDINDYKKWKAAWEKSYPIYRDLCKELEENRNLFERLGAEMRSAVAHEEQLRVIALIEKHYNERNEEMQKKNKKYKKLHAKLKSIKTSLLAFESRMNTK